MYRPDRPQAPAMQWNEGHTWTLDVKLPVGAINFKIVMQEPHGDVRWEEGGDRSVLIPETTSATGAPVGQVWPCLLYPTDAAGQ